MPRIQLKPGEIYKTKVGNHIKCLKEDEIQKKKYWCQYVDVVKGHESLLDKSQLWGITGIWDKYKGEECIHHVVKGVVL